MNVLPSQFALIKRGMDLATLNHQVVSANLANVNTPGYQAREVRFEDALRLLEQAEEAGEAGGSRAVVRQEPLEQELKRVIRVSSAPTARGDKNNVNMDSELNKLGQTSLMFQTLTDLLSTRLSEMRAAMEMR